jgi:hypothetical protein
LDEGQWYYAFSNSGLIFEGCTFDPQRACQTAAEPRLIQLPIAPLCAWLRQAGSGWQKADGEAKLAATRAHGKIQTQDKRDDSDCEWTAG